MNYLDFILLIPILIGAWKGFRKGFIIEIFTLLALFAGIYGAIHFSDRMSTFLSDSLDVKSDYLPIVAFSLTFLCVGAMVFFLGRVLEKAVSLVALSTINKFAGLVFGALKMLLVSSMLVVVLESIDEKNKFISKEFKESSLLYEPLRDITFTALPAIEDSQLFKNRSILFDLLNKKEDV
ncbi:MAG: CvpA family protein [Crocinitomicaceae bacterium]